MTRAIRSLIGILFVASVVWCSFNVRLGERTFAQHADRIGQTPEARDLMDGTRQEINPALDEATDRLLGEHIVAPTSERPEAVSSPGAGGPRPRVAAE